MTPPAAPSRNARTAPLGLWTTLLAILLALQLSAGAIPRAAIAEAGTAAAKLTLPTPLASQLRESGQAIKATAQRASTARPHEGQDGGVPPLPANAATLIPARALAVPHRIAPAHAGPRESIARAYRARAPPRHA